MADASSPDLKALIIELLREGTSQKASFIAAHLSKLTGTDVGSQTVNRILYGDQNTFVLTRGQENAPRWALKHASTWVKMRIGAFQLEVLEPMGEQQMKSIVIEMEKKGSSRNENVIEFELGDKSAETMLEKIASEIGFGFKSQ